MTSELIGIPRAICKDAIPVRFRTKRDDGTLGSIPKNQPAPFVVERFPMGDRAGFAKAGSK